MKSLDTPDNPMELVRYSDNSREVIMTLHRFSELDASAKVTNGLGLAQLALEDPIQMYRLFRKHLEIIARCGDITMLNVNEVEQADKYRSLQTEMASMLLNYLDTFPDSDIEVFDFRISVYPSKIDETAFGIINPIEIVNVHLNPPKYIG